MPCAVCVLCVCVCVFVCCVCAHVCAVCAVCVCVLCVCAMCVLCVCCLCCVKALFACTIYDCVWRPGQKVSCSMPAPSPESMVEAIPHEGADACISLCHTLPPSCSQALRAVEQGELLHVAEEFKLQLSLSKLKSPLCGGASGNARQASWTLDPRRVTRQRQSPESRDLRGRPLR
jgi:hypothetical protein